MRFKEFELFENYLSQLYKGSGICISTNSHSATCAMVKVSEFPKCHHGGKTKRKTTFSPPRLARPTNHHKGVIGGLLRLPNGMEGGDGGMGIALYRLPVVGRVGGGRFREGSLPCS